MRVLHAVTLHTPSHAFGGPTRVALSLSRGLIERGVDARLVTLGDEFDGPLPNEVEGVPAQLFQARHLIRRFGVAGITSPSLLARARRLVKSADVVHVHLMRDLVTLPIALAALQCGRPLVLQTHGMIDPTERLPAKISDAFGVRRVLRRADAVLCLTETERRNVNAVVEPVELTNTVRLANGVEPQGEYRPELRASSHGGPPTVLYLARVHPAKRPEDFIEAVPGVLGKHPEARFVLAGPDTGGLDATLARARALGVDGSVEYVGALDRTAVYEHLRRADVYVIPSIQESFSLSAAEAMSVGTPVVVTKTCGLAPDIEAAGAGRLVDSREETGGGNSAENGARIAGAILELLDPAVHAAASVAARRLIHDSFTIDAIVDHLQKVYADVRR
ncbi:glycosyltransferase [Streptomyces sp. RKAG337]|uniref:glycosyltransferase n=1 Tax=Streptomyces sp. RKAG337 TaxID=2893404 RepID=UPI0020336E0F|nr:glycosyltransferase [Streptomyces sp. RKAG337]MCM2428754.1 glycosyltransferase [Streptomyces sp. RKAG337]